MKITDITYVLLFILPGVFARKISNLLDIPNDEKYSEFGELINGILLSFPIMFLTFAIISAINGFKEVKQFITAFNDPAFLFCFVIIVIIISFSFGIIIGIFKGVLINGLNIVRKKLLKRIEIDDKTCWRKLFLDDKEPHYVEIDINGKIYKGITKWYSLPNEEKEIVIFMPDEWKYYPGIEKNFKTIKQIYINIEKNIVIKDYDMQEYNSFCEQLKKEQRETGIISSAEAEL